MSYIHLVEYDFYWQHDLKEQHFLQMASWLHRSKSFHLKMYGMNSVWYLNEPEMFMCDDKKFIVKFYFGNFVSPPKPIDHIDSFWRQSSVKVLSYFSFQILLLLLNESTMSWTCNFRAAESLWKREWECKS